MSRSIIDLAEHPDK